VQRRISRSSTPRRAWQWLTTYRSHTDIFNGFASCSCTGSGLERAGNMLPTLEAAFSLRVRFCPLEWHSKGSKGTSKGTFTQVEWRNGSHISRIHIIPNARLSDDASHPLPPLRSKRSWSRGSGSTPRLTLLSPMGYL
jgi:hypothetical protein